MTAMMTVTGQMTLMKFWTQVLDAFSTEIPPLSRKRYEIGTDPVNIKHPVARVSQQQLSFLLEKGLRSVFSDVCNQLPTKYFSAADWMS